MILMSLQSLTAADRFGDPIEAAEREQAILASLEQR